MAALLAALVVTGIGSAGAMAPQAAACEKHEKKDKADCSKTPGAPGSPGTPAPGTRGLRIAGSLRTADGGLTIDAMQVGSQVSGTASRTLGSTFSGPVIQIVPPFSATFRNDYCVAVNTAGNAMGINRLILYIRDSGDGLLTHDQLSTFASSDTNTNCTTNRDAVAPFVDSSSGDVTVSQTVT